MPEDTSVLHPLVQWAQRDNRLFVSIMVEDCPEPNVNIEEDSLNFSGKSGRNGKLYEVNVELFKQIDPEKSHWVNRQRFIDCVLMKKEPGPYWPRLLKVTQKQPWLKIDFPRWRDEDDSEPDEWKDEEENGGGDLSAMMRQMGGLGGDMNLQGLGDEDEDDEDDSEMPPLEEQPKPEEAKA